MKFLSNCDVVSFLRDVDLCEGEVLFSSEQGDVLNLKSQLSKYVFAVIAAKQELLELGSIVCSNKDDEDILRDYLITEA
ncbi:MAG: polya polymerase [Clostridiales bacterium]|nr:polya polymerase [Clostridiales bacterium]